MYIREAHAIDSRSPMGGGGAPIVEDPLTLGERREVAQVCMSKMALEGMPGQVLPMVVEKITPVATAEEGRNYFRVEAGLGESPAGPRARLRPGMQVIGKVAIGTEKLAWIYTHKLVHAVRMSLWSWFD